MKNNPPILVSACLAGLATRYDASSAANTYVLELVRQGRALPVCPEQLGGRPTPRAPNEIRNGRVIDAYGNDWTAEFFRGAEQALELAKLAGCSQAILKARSPSCGFTRIYDGSFSGQLVSGHGVFAALLHKNNIKIYSEEDFP